jgi:hypothetical protein
MTEQDPYQPNPGETLLFENERVRVWSMTVDPGNAGLWHSHQHDHVLIWPWDGKSKGQMWGDDEPTTTQNAQESFVLFKAVGKSGLHPHRLHNVDIATKTHFIVELLEPSPYEEEGPYVHNDRGESFVDTERESASGDQ